MRAMAVAKAKVTAIANRLTGREGGPRLPTVKAVMPAKTLGELLAGKPPGSWVVMDPGMTEVKAVADSPEQAMLDAGYTGDPSPDADTDSLPVLVQVAAPGLKFY